MSLIPGRDALHLASVRAMTATVMPPAMGRRDGLMRIVQEGALPPVTTKTRRPLLVPSGDRCHAMEQSLRID